MISRNLTMSPSYIFVHGARRECGLWPWHLKVTVRFNFFPSISLSVREWWLSVLIPPPPLLTPCNKITLIQATLFFVLSCPCPITLPAPEHRSLRTCLSSAPFIPSFNICSISAYLHLFVVSMGEIGTRVRREREKVEEADESRKKSVSRQQQQQSIEKKERWNTHSLRKGCKMREERGEMKQPSFVTSLL